MTQADEWSPKIEELLKDKSVDGVVAANILVKSLIDDGTVIYETANVPFIDLDWKLTLKCTGKEWNKDADKDDVEKLADDICDAEGLDYESVDHVKVDGEKMCVYLDRIGFDDGIPSGSKATHCAKVEVTGEQVKNLITPTPKDDDKIVIDCCAVANTDEASIKFSDGSKYVVKSRQID